MGGGTGDQQVEKPCPNQSLPAHYATNRAFHTFVHRAMDPSADIFNNTARPGAQPFL
jgi:hypothetical protein